MAEEEPTPLQSAIWEAEATGDPWDGSAKSGQHLLNQHRDSASSLCPGFTTWHAEGNVTCIMCFTLLKERYMIVLCQVGSIKHVTFYNKIPNLITICCLKVILMFPDNEREDLFPFHRYSDISVITTHTVFGHTSLHFWYMYEFAAVQLPKQN